MKKKLLSKLTLEQNILCSRNCIFIHYMRFHESFNGEHFSFILEIFFKKFVKPHGGCDLKNVSTPICEGNWWSKTNFSWTTKRRTVCYLLCDDHFYNVYFHHQLHSFLRVVIKSKDRSMLCHGPPSRKLSLELWWRSSHT